MRNVNYDYSSCHIDVPDELSQEIIEWGEKHVPDENIFVAQRDPTFGREDEIHITILYGIHADSPESVRPIIEHSGPINVRLGKVDVFTNPFKFDVLMIEVFSDELMELN